MNDRHLGLYAPAACDEPPERAAKPSFQRMSGFTAGGPPQRRRRRSAASTPHATVLPDSLAIWSFTCQGGKSYQLIIWPDQSLKFFECDKVALDKTLVPCFTPAPKK
jgi:hypothetical protein